MSYSTPISYTGITVQSDFPLERRPIYVTPVTSVTHKNKANAYPQLAAAISRLLGSLEGRTLIHTVSYDLAKFLREEVSWGSHRVFGYTESHGKNNALQGYLRHRTSVLLAPSMERGIDLPLDSCRSILVTKIPFPSLGDKQISARLHSKGGQTWYSVKTVRSLVQMTGRGMRSADDFCESYILDRQFIESTWRKNKQLLPHWWREALVWDKGAI